jgi:flagellar hook-basal body complex protein FliE
MPAQIDWATTRARAQAIAEMLEQATTNFNAAIQKAEDVIKSLRLGVPGQATLQEWDDTSTGITHYRILRFTKWDKEWRLVVEFTSDVDDEGHWEPLLNVSRDLRLRAMEVLPDLVEDMIKNATDEVTEVTNAADKAQAFIANITLSERKTR